MQTTLSQKRCHSCGEWNELQQGQELCSHCHKPLNPVSEAEKANIEMRKNSWEIAIPIYPEDSALKRVFKHSFNAVQFVFMAIVSFFLWLFLLGPG
ncbi:MAG TPA: hypothetical protein PL185_02570 [Flavobacteriales bacterium]|nr:hypothetical protein [Flavobacteriales bacterium]